MYKELMNFFENANKTFIQKNLILFQNKVHEQCLAGSLAQILFMGVESLFNGYYVDVEYNKSSSKPKTIRNNDGTIRTDLIIHSRKEKKEQDNLICIEMKKKGNFNNQNTDKKRLKELTINSNLLNSEQWNNNVYGYKLGIYYEIDFKNLSILLEYYANGERFCKKSVGISENPEYEIIDIV
jgi:hypothetical protein